MSENYLSYCFLKSHRQLLRYFSDKMSGCPVSLPQFFILLLLSYPKNKSGMYVYQLSEELGLKSCTITRNIVHLGSYIQREKECFPGDGRKSLITITSMGQNLVKKYLSRFEEVDLDLSKKWPSLLGSLKQMSAHFVGNKD